MKRNTGFMRVLKIWHKIVGVIFLFIILLLFFLSTILRLYITKKSENIIGRKIDLSALHINYFRCTVTAENFVMYEKKDTARFLIFKELLVNFDPLHLLKNEYAFSEIKLVAPRISVISLNNGFNFDDLLKSSDTTVTEKPAEGHTKTVKFLIRNLTITGGYIRYEDKATASVSELNQLAIKLPEIAWNNNKSMVGIDFILGEKGKVSLEGSINQASDTYSLKIKTENIDIAPFSGYLKPFMDVSSVTGLLNTDLMAEGEMANPMNVKVFGEAGISNLNVTDRDNKHFFSSKELIVKTDSLDIGKGNFCIDTFRIEEPGITTVLEPKGTNIGRILAPLYADTISAAKDTVAVDSTELHYSIKNLIINKGSVSFTDLTLNRPFQYTLADIDFSMAGYSDTARNVTIDLGMILNQAGTFKGKAVVDPVGLRDITFDGEIKNMDLVSLAPYSEYYLAKPITKGTFNYNCKLIMTPAYLKNDNALKIVNLEMGKKTKDTTAIKVPVGLALFILKDRHNIIGFDLPVTGNPSSPSFTLGKIIWKTLKEFLIKTAAAPFNAIAGVFGVSPESIKQIPFEFMQDSLNDAQRKNLDKIAEIISRKNELIFTFSQTTDQEKEKELLSIQEAKILFVNSISSAGANADSIMKQAMELPDNNPGFSVFLGMGEPVSNDSISAYCSKKVSPDLVLKKFNDLLKKRENLLKNYFLEKQVPVTSVIIKTADLKNLAEELKKPQFVVEITLN